MDKMVSNSSARSITVESRVIMEDEIDIELRIEHIESDDISFRIYSGK